MSPTRLSKASPYSPVAAERVKATLPYLGEDQIIVQDMVTVHRSNEAPPETLREAGALSAGNG